MPPTSDPRQPDSPDDGPVADADGKRSLGENPDSDVLPISPGRRRNAMIIGIIFLLVILGFLLWFMGTHTEQSEGGGMLGYGEVTGPGER